MIYYFVPAVSSTIIGVLIQVHDMTEINFDSFDARFFVSVLIAGVYGIRWPKKMVNRGS
jgi:hypothetical protein